MARRNGKFAWENRIPAALFLGPALCEQAPRDNRALKPEIGSDIIEREARDLQRCDCQCGMPDKSTRTIVAGLFLEFGDINYAESDEIRNYF